VRFGLVLLTQYKVIQCFNVLISSRRTRSATAWLSVNGTRVADFLQKVDDTSQFQPLSGNLFNSFRAPQPSTDKDFFYENSVFVCDFHDFNFYLMQNKQIYRLQ